MDTGITSYGVYVPRYRMGRKTIFNAMGWLNPSSMPGEKAVANYDEDSITMAASAGMDCLKEVEKGVEGVFFASTTPPYGEGQGAGILGTALGLDQNIRSTDFGGSLRAGTSALLSACEAVAAGNTSSILVCASDSRIGRPGTAQEMTFGDGAGAVAVGRDNVIATFEGAYSVSYDFPDYRRLANEKYIHSVEERFIREQGYAKFIQEVISGLLQKCGLTAKDLTRVAFPCLNVRDYGAIGKRLGFQPDQMQEPLLAALGELGSASPFVLLAGMLDVAKPDDKILVASYGSGAEALLFRVTQKIYSVKKRGRFARSLARKKELSSYEKYLAFRGILPIDMADLGMNPPTQLPNLWRERKSVLALYGSKCKQCGTPHYPPQNVCVNPDCGAINDMEEYGFSRRDAKLFSFTVDRITFLSNPPFIYGLVDFYGGGRFVFELTDCDAEEIQVGMPLTMSFRKKFDDSLRGVQGYFWKAVPALEG